MDKKLSDYLLSNRNSRATTVIKILESGPCTYEDIYQKCIEKYGHSISSLNLVLEILEELGFIESYTHNGETIYRLRKRKDSKPSTEEVSERRFFIPMERNYNWNDYIPDSCIEYVEQRDELRKVEVGERFRIEGPPGCGKTLLVEYYCYKKRLPLFEIQGYGAHVADLIGRPWIVKDTSFWSDGLLTKAILCSRERPCVLLVDEFNRMDPREQAAFLEISDFRCQLSIPATGEVLKGNPQNLKIFLTMNVGSEYFVHRLDDAVKRRFPCIKLDFLGLVNPELEVKAIVEQSSISKSTAEVLVKVANEIRKAATTKYSTITRGIPTHNVIEWAKLINAYTKVGIENPIVEAGIDTVASFYEGSARVEVEQIIYNYCDTA